MNDGTNRPETQASDTYLIPNSPNKLGKGLARLKVVHKLSLINRFLLLLAHKFSAFALRSNSSISR